MLLLILIISGVNNRQQNERFRKSLTFPFICIIHLAFLQLRFYFCSELFRPLFQLFNMRKLNWPFVKGSCCLFCFLIVLLVLPALILLLLSHYSFLYLSNILVKVSCLNFWLGGGLDQILFFFCYWLLNYWRLFFLINSLISL